MADANNLQKLHTILISVLGVKENEIVDTMSPSTVPAWDSYNALMIVSELESGFSVHFTMDEVVAVQNFGDIKNALRKHGVQL